MQAGPRHVPYHRYTAGAAEEQALLEVLRSGWLTTGSKVKAFEAAFCGYARAAHAVGTTSCTTGLQVLLASLPGPALGPGDEVVTTPFTFASTANVIVHTGARPVFADVDPATLNLSAETIAPRITSRTRAIIVVHVAGNMAPMDDICALAKPLGIAIVEDCAHALGAWHKGKHAGTFGAGGSFSFYPNKNITTGEGGMAVCEDAEMAHRLRLWRNHGLDYPPFERQQFQQYKQYDIVLPGQKCNMNELQAALGLCQLAQMPAWRARRKAIFDQYAEALGALDGCWLTMPPPHCESAYHLAVVRLRPEALRLGREQVMAAIIDRGVKLSVSFKPVHLFSYYRQLGYNPGDFPAAEAAWANLFSLPLYPSLSDADVAYVIEIVRDAVRKAGR